MSSGALPNGSIPGRDARGLGLACRTFGKEMQIFSPCRMEILGAFWFCSRQELTI